MEQSKLTISIEIERGANLDVTLRDAIQSFLDEKETLSAICEKCGKDIYKISKTPEKTIEFSQKYHDGVFCYNCQQELRKEKGEG